MPISYAKVWPYFTCSLLADAEEMQLIEDRRLLLFDPVLERVGTTSVGQRLRQIDPAIRESNLLVLRVRSNADMPELERDLDVLQRLSGADTLLALSGAGEGTPQIHVLVGTVNASSSQWLSFLKRIELEGILARTQALFQDSRVHYLLPSQDHADAFIRLADALHDPTEVSR
jgi:hypothetical protein